MKMNKHQISTVLDAFILFPSDNSEGLLVLITKELDSKGSPYVSAEVRPLAGGGIISGYKSVREARKQALKTAGEFANIRSRRNEAANLIRKLSDALKELGE